MYFANLHALLVMEGHGVYVWTAYLVTLLVIALTLLLPLRRSRRLLQQSALEVRRVQGPTGDDHLHKGVR
jgi:heme exporter protein D